MENFDDLLTEKTNKDNLTQHKRYSKEEYTEYKQNERDIVYAIIDTAAIEVSQKPDKFKEYLDMLSHFDRYSVSNNLLIMAQKPDATNIKDYDNWDKLKAYVLKGEKSILLLEPGNTYTASDGSQKQGFNIRHVFDISQTDSKITNRFETKQDDRLLIRMLMNNAPVDIQAGTDVPANLGAIYNPEISEIRVRPGMDANSIFKALSHELAHAGLNTGIDRDRVENDWSANAVSYILCRKAGYNVDSFDFSNVKQQYSGADTKSIRADLSLIRETANEISLRMTQTLDKQVMQKDEVIR